MGGLERMIANSHEGVSVTGSAEADAFLRGSADGLMYAALFDQQMRAELAFIGAYRLHERLGHLDADRIAASDLDDLVAVFREKPGIHRFGQMMAERAQRLAAHMVREHNGSIVALWSDGPSDTELIRRFADLPGFGPSKAGVLLEALDLFGHRGLADR